MKTLKVGITLGDIGGVGPELVVRILQESGVRDRITPIIYGPGRALGVFRKILKVDRFNYNIIQNPEQAQPKKISLIDPGPKFERVEIGKASKIGGEAAFKALESAVKDLKANKIDFLVTMPIDKKSIHGGSFPFPGHTEYLAQSFDNAKTLMLMVHDEMRVGVVTGHIPLSEVSEKLTKELIVEKIKVMDKTLRRDFNIEKPRIAVLGLNPHSGDNGLLGKEDAEVIEPAVKSFNKDHTMVMGPFSPDGFFGSGHFARFDGILAMYHDQGLIPFKLHAGFEGVNFTAGLPEVRISPDHGVAYDLAGKGRADLDSVRNAIFYGIDICRGRGLTENLEANALKPPRRDEPKEDEAIPTQEELAKDEKATS